MEFDKAIRERHPRAGRQGRPLRGQYFLHRSCVPLDHADLDPTGTPTRRLRLVTTGPDENDDPHGCSPWSCRSGDPSDTPRAA